MKQGDARVAILSDISRDPRARPSPSLLFAHAGYTNQVQAFYSNMIYGETPSIAASSWANVVSTGGATGSAFCVSQYVVEGRCARIARPVSHSCPRHTMPRKH